MFQLQMRFQDAEIAYKQAIKIRPDFVEVHSNLGLLFQEQKRYQESYECYQNALCCQPNNIDALSNLGNLCFEQKQYEEAEVFYRLAMKSGSNNALANTKALFNFSTLLLFLGHFQEGWKYYEMRYHQCRGGRQTHLLDIGVPLWQGESLANKRILIYPEQGVGDEVMFASCLEEFKDIQARIVLACDARLEKLFSRSFPFVEVIVRDPENGYTQIASELDYHCAIGSLAKYVRHGFKDFEKSTPYLRVDEGLLKKWKARYSQLKYSANIGISWRGGMGDKQQKKKSIELMEWLPILKHEANFINLQYGDYQEEINDFEQLTGIHLYDWEDADPLNDLDNFAAQINALDLVISISNTTVHFAGALGISTMLLLPYNQSWRWFEGRLDSPWYPGVMTLFRQQKEDEWKSVIHAVENSLDKRLS